MTYPLLAFVSAPTIDAAVRFDFNSDFGDAQCSTNADGFSIGAPTLEGDPSSSGAVYGYRNLSLTPRLTGPKSAVLSALTALARELLRAENWLLFQLDELTDPVWFKVYKSPPQPLSLDEVDIEARNPDAWTISLTLIADAFARGAMVTHEVVTVAQEPDGMSFELPAIKGDAPTPLRVQVKPTTSGNAGAGAEILLGCLSSSSPTEIIVADIGTGDGFTAGPGVGSGTSGALYFGGTYRNLSMSGLPTLTPRLSGYLPPVSPGRHKVMLRCEITGDTAETWVFMFQGGTAIDVNRAPNYNPPVTITVVPGVTTTFVRRVWIDLGTFQLPAGVAIPRSLAADVLAPVLSPAFFLRVNSGNGKVDATDTTRGAVRLDAIALIPVDTLDVYDATMLRTRYPEVAPVGASDDLWVAATYDGETATDWLTSHVLDGGGLTEGLYPSVSVPQGGFPVADPAAESNLMVLIAQDHGERVADASADPTITSTGAECDVAVSYHPYHLHLAGEL